MPFKIVSTRRRGKAELCTVPSRWECKGKLRWPKRNADLLCKQETAHPRPDWLTFNCILKRRNFQTYEDAEQELDAMLDQTDTDADFDPSSQNIRHLSSKNSTTVTCPNLNSMAQSLMDSSNTISIHNPSPVITDENTGIVYQIVTEEGPTQVIENVPTQQPVDNEDQLLQQINTIVMVQNVILNNQERMMKKISELSVQLDELKQSRQSVTTLSQAKGTQANKQITMKAIDNIQGLQQLEKQLSNPETFEALQQKYPIICSVQPGTGNNCAYRLLDALFTREFLCQCSWTGGSRNADVKIGFKRFKNVISFYFSLVNSWDNTYTIQDTENFFKMELRNALKRKDMKNIRTSAQKKRVKKNRSGKENNSTDGNNEKNPNQENENNHGNENNNDGNEDNENNNDGNEENENNNDGNEENDNADNENEV